VDILKFSDYVCKKLLKRNIRPSARLGAMVGDSNNGNESILERIANKDGNACFKVTDNEVKRGRNMGKSFHLNCYVWWKYLDPDIETATSKLCSDVMTVRGLSVRKTAAIQPLDGTKVVSMNM